MNPSGPSIFDLSPSEKLQLVAGTPEAVPVHNGRSKSEKSEPVEPPNFGTFLGDMKQRIRRRR